MTVTAYAGTQLKVLNAELERLGLSLHNMGDIAEQTLAGAISTGTHGTGGVAAGLAAQLAGLQLVTGTGEVARRHAATQNADVFELARVGLGALGILTTVTFARRAALPARGARAADVVGRGARRPSTTMVAESHHCDMYWFPHTDRLLTKRNTRLDADVSEAAAGLAAAAAGSTTSFLSNTVFGALTAGANRVPGVIPRMNQVSARVLSAAHLQRRRPPGLHLAAAGRLPRDGVRRAARGRARRAARGAPAWSTRRTGGSASRSRSGSRPADDIPLSTAYGRDSFYLAFHTHHRSDWRTHAAYIEAMERVMRDHDGRPHWGKLHTRTAADLAPAYPRFGEFLALRDRLDPDRVFTNDYLRRVLGD